MVKKISNVDPSELSHAPDAVSGGLKCAFSDKRTVKVGTGSTTKRHEQNVYWYVEQIAPELFGVWMLNKNGVPTGSRKEMSKDKLLSTYYPELQYYNEHVAPKVMEMTGAVERGDRRREISDFSAAEAEYDIALKLDVENVRAVFGLGLSYLSRGEIKKAHHTFQDLIALEAAFAPEHKHLFNEMGIQLRKNKMFNESVAFYMRALKLGKEDAHLFYNLSRVYYEADDWSGCLNYLKRCLYLDQNLNEALNLLELAMEMVGNTKVREKHAKPPLDTEAAHLARDLWDTFVSVQPPDISDEDDSPRDEINQLDLSL